MRKLVYILSVGGLLIATACNDTAKFDQAECERRADSIVVTRINTELPTLTEEASEMCAEQLALLTSTRDSLNTILNTASASRGSYTGKKSTGTKTTTTKTTTPTDPAPNTGKKGSDEPVNTGKKGSDAPVNTGKKQ